MLEMIFIFLYTIPDDNFVDIMIYEASMQTEKLLERRRKLGMVPDAIGASILAYRLKRGLTIAELAELAQVAPNLITNLETGQRKGNKLTIGVLRRIAVVLDVSLDALAPFPPHSPYEVIP